MAPLLMSLGDCRRIVKLSLLAIGQWSPAAEDLLLGTALQESGLRARRQDGGPALGLWQMEPATHDDIWETFLLILPSRAPLAASVRGLLDPGDAMGRRVPPAAVLEHSDRYACAMARLKYFRSPRPLPELGDIAGYAAYWKEIYNAGGRGTEAEFIAHWHALAAPQAA